MVLIRKYSRGIGSVMGAKIKAGKTVSCTHSGALCNKIPVFAMWFSKIYYNPRVDTLSGTLHVFLLAGL